MKLVVNVDKTFIALQKMFFWEKKLVLWLIKLKKNYCGNYHINPTLHTGTTEPRLFEKFLENHMYNNNKIQICTTNICYMMEYMIEVQSFNTEPSGSEFVWQGKNNLTHFIF
jgi:hypothetical protein